MIEVQLSDYTPQMAVNGFVRGSDLLDNKKIIYLGCPLDELEKAVKGKSEIFYVKPEIANLWGSYSLHLERKIERIITHETLHIIIFSLTTDLNKVKKLDNIDEDSYENRFPISGYGMTPLPNV
jgi:hypothetical protein